MKGIKHELQGIIIGNGQDDDSSKLRKVQGFLRSNAQAGSESKKQEHLKSEEEPRLIDFAQKEGVIFTEEISEHLFISEGAEQRVYRFDDYSIIKLNGRIFYECWLDYLTVFLFTITSSNLLRIIFWDLRSSMVICMR